MSRGWLAARASGMDAIALRYQAFPDYAQAAAPASSGAHPKPHLKRHHRLRSPDEARHTAAIDRLRALVLQEVGSEPDGFIRLSATDFIVFVSDTARMAVGLYRVDLATNTISDPPFARGDVGVVSTLKDKSGDDYMLLHHYYEQHQGAGGESYSLLSARRTARGRIIVNLKRIGEADEYADGVDACASPPQVVFPTTVAATVKDVNHDGHPDIVVSQTLFDCASKRKTARVTRYLAMQTGFAQPVALDARHFALARKQAMAVYAKGAKYEKTNPQGAAQVLERAGIGQIRYARPAGMTVQAYAALLNDYAFFIGPYGKAEQALDMLDHVIRIAPDRGVAYLNRAETEYEMLYLGQFLTQQAKLAAARDIMKDYARYKKLTGRKVAWLEQFSAFNLAHYPKDANVCSYVMQYARAGRAHIGLYRMGEIRIASRHLDIDNDGKAVDVTFTPGRYGYQTYGSLTFHDPGGKAVTVSGAVSPKVASGWGFRVFGFKGKRYLLLPMDDVSIVDHDKEKLVCESEWSGTPGGSRTLLAVRPTGQAR